MSNSETIKYTCPYCGKEFDVEIYNTVNVSQDPDLKERCMSGDIFRHSCPHCHSDFMIQNPLLYEDTEHRFIIWVSAKELGDLSSFAKPLIAVELAKYDSFIDFLDSRKGKAEDVTSIDYVYTKDDVMKIDIRMDDKGMSFLIPVSGLHDELEANKEMFEIEDEQFPCINSDWILSVFMKAQGNV